MRVGVDIDGVLRNLVLQVRIEYLKSFPNHKVPLISKWKKYNMREYFPIKDGFWDFVYCEKAVQIYVNAPMYCGAKNFMNKLCQKHDVSIVSKQPTELTKLLTKKWLSQHQIPFHKLMFVKNKAEFKGDFLLDDCTQNAWDCRLAMSSIPIIMNRPWNQDYPGMRIYKYSELFKIIK